MIVISFSKEVGAFFGDGALQIERGGIYYIVRFSRGLVS